MKKAIIFCHGDLPRPKKVLTHIKKGDLIICANGGTNHVLKLRLIPHVIIGDHDSLPLRSKKKLKDSSVKFIKHLIDKDQTDSELAIDYAVKKGFKNILVFGAFGKRLDHSLANLFLPTCLKYKTIKIIYIHGDQEIFITKNQCTIKGKKGDLLSLIPLKEDCLGVTTKGLKWPLKNSVLSFGKTRGISNVFTDKKAEIRIKKGLLLAIHTRL